MGVSKDDGPTRLVYNETRNLHTGVVDRIFYQAARIVGCSFFTWIDREMGAGRLSELIAEAEFPE